MGPLRSSLVCFFNSFSTISTAIGLLTLPKQYAIMSPHRQRGLLAHERGLLSPRSQSLPVLTTVRRKDMMEVDATLKVEDGLLRDRVTGNYLVLSGYSNQALRYAMGETWLDEDDNLWIAGDAVQREIR